MTRPPLSPASRQRGAWLAAAVLAILALALPPAATGASLVREGGPSLGDLVLGLWLFKGLLLLHAGLLLLIARSSAPDRPEEGLIPKYWSPDRELLPAGVAGLLMVGLVLRLVHLGSGLWFDEIQTLLDYVRLPLAQILTTFDSQNQHMLYTVAAGISTSILGEGNAALRLPAVLFGVVSLWAAYRLGTLVTSRTEAFLAAALLTVSFHHIWFSQNARGYTGLLLWTLVASRYFLRLLAGDYAHGWQTAAAYGMVVALAAYTHSTAILIAVAHGFIWLGWQILRRKRVTNPESLIPLAGLGLAASLTLLLYAPVLPQFVETVVHPPAGGAETAWQSPLWFLAEMASGLGRGVPGGWIVLGAGLVVVSAGIVSYWRRSPVVLTTMLLPVLITAAAITGLKHNLWPRFFFFAAGFGVLIVIRGGFAIAEWAAARTGFALHGRLAATVATLLIIAGSAVTVPRAWGPKQDFVGAERFVESKAQPGDAVVTVDLTAYPYRQYLKRDWPTVTSADSLAEVEQKHRATWVVYTFPIRLQTIEPEIWQRLQTDYETAAVFPGTLGGGAVVVMVTRSPDSAI